MVHALEPPPVEPIGFAMVHLPGGHGRFKGRLALAVDGRSLRPTAAAWTEVRLFERGRARGGYVLAVSVHREAAGFDDLHLALEAADLEAAMAALEAVDPCAEIAFGRVRKARKAVAAIAARAALDDLARDHAAVVDAVLASLAALPAR